MAEIPLNISKAKFLYLSRELSKGRGSGIPTVHPLRAVLALLDVLMAPYGAQRGCVTPKSKMDTSSPGSPMPRHRVEKLGYLRRSTPLLCSWNHHLQRKTLPLHHCTSQKWNKWILMQPPSIVGRWRVFASLENCASPYSQIDLSRSAPAVLDSPTSSLLFRFYKMKNNLRKLCQSQIDHSKTQKCRSFSYHPASGIPDYTWQETPGIVTIFRSPSIR